MLLLTLLACPAPGPDSGASFDCAEVALRDGDGPDACDLPACQHCVDACGADCMILESYPPQYSCGDTSWTVYDDCPDWTPPSSAEPSAVEVSDEGCGIEGATLDLSSTSAGRIDVTHTDYLLGCCPEDVQVDVSTTGSTLSVEYTLISDLCDCACLLDVSYAIVDVPAGRWTVEAPQSGATAEVDVAAQR